MICLWTSYKVFITMVFSCHMVVIVYCHIVVIVYCHIVVIVCCLVIYCLLFGGLLWVHACGSFHCCSMGCTVVAWVVLL